MAEFKLIVDCIIAISTPHPLGHRGSNAAINDQAQNKGPKAGDADGNDLLGDATTRREMGELTRPHQRQEANVEIFRDDAKKKEQNVAQEHRGASNEIVDQKDATGDGSGRTNEAFHLKFVDATCISSLVILRGL